MGCSCGLEIEKPLTEEIKGEPLDNFQRYKVFTIPEKHPYLAVHDFSQKETICFKPKLGETLTDYSAVCAWPLVYIVGGRNIAKGTISKKVWSASYAQDEVPFEATSRTRVGRISPFLVHPDSKYIYAIGGYNRPIKDLQNGIVDCERYSLEKQAWTNIPSLNSPVMNVIHSGNYIYGFGILEPESHFQRLNLGDLVEEWEILFLKISKADEVAFTGIKEYGFSSTSGGDEIFIYGGVDIFGKKTTSYFSGKRKESEVMLHSSAFTSPTSFVDCHTDTDFNHYYITKEMKLSTFHKISRTWTISKTDLKQKIAKLD